eukprot:jgi/Mesvir1/3467/Mv11960-RA.1
MEDDDGREQWEKVDKLKFTVLLGLGLGLEHVVLYPLDALKTRQQVARGIPVLPVPTHSVPVAVNEGSQLSSPVKYIAQRTPSKFQELHAAWRQVGLRGLYRGLSWGLIGGLPSEVLSYAGYYSVRDQLMATSFGKNHPNAVYTVTGGLVDLSSLLLWVPFDIIMQHAMVHDHAKPFSGAKLAVELLQREGIRGLYRGLGITALMHVPSTASWWLSYELCKEKLIKLFWVTHASSSSSADTKHRVTDTSITSRETDASIAVSQTNPIGLKRNEDASIKVSQTVRITSRQTDAGIASKPAVPTASTWAMSGVHVISGIAAGIVSSVVCHPMDVVKTNIQTSAKSVGILGALRNLNRDQVLQGRHAWTWVTRGLTPRIIASAPRSAVGIVAVEYLMTVCTKPLPPDNASAGSMADNVALQM